MTSPGRVLGTVGYMSPEQVRVEPAGARSDIFAVGAILYEMLTGERAFRRIATETMAAILNDVLPSTCISDLSTSQHLGPGHVVIFVAGFLS